MNEDRPRVALLDIPIDAVDLDRATAAVSAMVESQRSHHVVTANVDFLAQAGRDPTLRAILGRADLVVADGVPLLWMARAQGTPLPGRVNGTDLTRRLMTEAASRGWRVFLLGGDPGVAAAARRVLTDEGVTVVDAAGPDRSAMEDPATSRTLARRVAASGADLLLLAIGGGRQEHWIDRHRTDLGPVTAIGVGSALDFMAGARRRAPRWMQRTGLEWAFRLALEPGRLWRRYLVDDTAVLGRFAWRLAIRRPSWKPPTR